MSMLMRASRGLEATIRGTDVSEKIVPPPLPGAKPVSATLPPPLPGVQAATGVPPPPLPGQATRPPSVPGEGAAAAVDERAAVIARPTTTDALFSFPPLASSTTAPAPPAPSENVIPSAASGKLAAATLPSRAEANEARVAKPVQAKRGAWVVGGIAVLVLLGLAVYFFVAGSENSAAPAAPAVAANPVQQAAPDAPPAPPADVPTEAQSILAVESMSAADAVPAADEKSPPKASAPGLVPAAKAPAANRLEQLEGSFYLFRNSIQKTSRGYRMAYAVLNSDIAPGSELSGKVKSQVFRLLVNCQKSTWGYDQRYYHARAFGEGDRLDERVWVISEVKFKPIRDSIQDKRMFELMCP